MSLSRYAKKTIGILGAARSGLALGKGLRVVQAIPIFWDDTPQGRQTAQDQGFQVSDITQEAFWTNNKPDLLCVSPGIAHLYPTMHPAIRLAVRSHVLVDNDISLYLQDYTGTSVGITGSNGKSTTSALIHHLLKTSGRDVELGGNIGNAVFNLPETPNVVLELSSYQTDLAQYLKTSIAVFINLSDDHLDRHNGRGGYFAAKERLIAQANFAVIGVDEPEGIFLANRYSEKILLMSVKYSLRGSQPSIFVEKNRIILWNGMTETHAFTLENANGLLGVHNQQNACAAVAVATRMGLTPDQIQQGLNSYKSLAHRMEEVAVINGVKFINDSKATNADAAEKALNSFQNILWIAGGVAKDGGITTLAPLFDRIKKTYLIGQAAEAFGHTLINQNTTISHTLENAVNTAFEEAEAGDVILLSPACASFDQFNNFEHRGDVFRSAVLALQEKKIHADT
jgi:UDP-N-acetylmuramoylalanine--D-glutamate ligase